MCGYVTDALPEDNYINASYVTKICSGKKGKADLKTMIEWHNDPANEETIPDDAQVSAQVFLLSSPGSGFKSSFKCCIRLGID